MFYEDFHTLEQWKPFYFSNVKKHTIYTTVTNGNEHYLRADSNNSASALIHKEAFNIYEYPGSQWEWKISNVYKKADPMTKSGDDYPVRIYFLFKYDPEQASFFEKLKYGFLKKIYGEYPPQSSLNYVWANRENADTIWTARLLTKSK